MRIVRGEYKSRRIALPKGFTSRPTTDLAKEGLFNILHHQFDLEQCSVLDLCSGTGNLSLEFISCGATHVTSVDSNPKCIQFLKKICGEWEVAPHRYKTYIKDCRLFVQKIQEQYDLILFDPPYDSGLYASVIDTIKDRCLLKPGGWLIVEHSARQNLDVQWDRADQKNYGGVIFSFFQAD